jgi:hypothetical protein
MPAVWNAHITPGARQALAKLLSRTPPTAEMPEVLETLAAAQGTPEAPAMPASLKTPAVLENPQER